MLLYLPLGTRTIPAILARSRDKDNSIRKLVYSTVLEQRCIVPAGPDGADEAIGVVHPRALTIAQRELIIRNGLGDREETVKTAASRLIGTWLEAVRGPSVKEEGRDIEADVLAFLKLFDLVESSTAEDALMNIFKARADILDALNFDRRLFVQRADPRYHV